MPGERKRCNQLDGKAWTRYSISVWSDLKKTPAEARLKHPASFPLQLAGRCIEIFTAGPGDVVFDPFAGSGTTLIGAYNLGRQGIGLELYDSFTAVFAERFAQEAQPPDDSPPPPEPRLYRDDARNMRRYLEPGTVDFVLTSPPYWNILLSRRSADGQQQRDYGESPLDLGRTGDYSAYIAQLAEVFTRVSELLKPGGYCVVAVMDLRKKNRFYPLHIDLSAALLKCGFALDDIIIWDRRHEYNRLRPLGYPAVFRVNKTHEFLMIFKKQQ